MLLVLTVANVGLDFSLNAVKAGNFYLSLPNSLQNQHFKHVWPPNEPHDAGVWDNRKLNIWFDVALKLVCHVGWSVHEDSVIQDPLWLPPSDCNTITVS